MVDLQFLALLAHDAVECEAGCGHVDRIPDLWVELLGGRVMAIPAQRIAA